MSSNATKTPRIRTAPAPEPEPTGPPEPSPDELVARRMLDYHGDSVIDIYIKRIRTYDAAREADRDGPFSGYLGLRGWCASRQLWSEERHATAARVGLLESLRDGGPPDVPDEAAIAAAVARDLVALFCQNCHGGFGRLVAAARRKVAAAVAELAEIGPRATGGEFFNPARAAGWRELRDLLTRQQELTLARSRWESLLAKLGPALAERVGDAIDAAGVDRVVLGMCLASLPTAPASLESDPTLIRLGADLAAARGRHEALSDAGSPQEKAALTDLERELSEPIALAIRERREVLAAERSRAATESLSTVRTSVAAARAGDVAALEALIAASTSRPGDFPESLASRLHDAAVAAFVEDAGAWGGLLETA